MALIFQRSSGILCFFSPHLRLLCHFERNYTWSQKHLPISGSLINFCPCRFGSRTDERNAENRKTSYIKVALKKNPVTCPLYALLFIFIFIGSFLVNYAIKNTLLSLVTVDVGLR